MTTTAPRSLPARLVITKGNLLLGSGVRTPLAAINNPSDINYFYSGYLRGHRRIVSAFFHEADEILRLASLEDLRASNLHVADRKIFLFRLGAAAGYAAGVLDGISGYPDYYFTYKRRRDRSGTESGHYQGYTA
jgi:hypothetical protein